MVAALPVVVAGYEEDWSGFSDRPGDRPIAAMGQHFVNANGERSYFLFMIARWVCIPFTWIGALVCYLWARDFFGKPAGVLACTLWCFSPNILAHGSLITTDAHATALGLAACYTFWRWLKKPTWAQAALTGCVLGLAELAKTTLILFYPLWPLLWVVYRWSDRKQMVCQDWGREAGMLILRMVIGLFILNVGYDFEGSFKPLRKFHFVSDLFTSQPDTNESLVEKQPLFAEPSSANRFANTWVGYLPVPFPENYLLGIDVQQRDFENFHSLSYLRGKFKDHGWWYYYLYAIAIKVPLGTLGLAVLVLIARNVGLDTLVDWRDEMILLAPPLIIFAVVSSKTGFSHHMRYVLPCFPFGFVWVSQVVQLPSARVPPTNTKAPRFGDSKFALALPILSCLLLVWSGASSLLVYPHSLSYFNESVGGPVGGANHLLHSNIDWGQDLRYLKWWREAHVTDLKGKRFYLAYDGLADPAQLGFVDALPWPLQKHEAPNFVPLPGHYAISVNFLRGSSGDAMDGRHPKGKLKQAVPRYFRRIQPCGRAGYSILIYKLDSDQVELMQKELGATM
jgi:hypothetical protein